MQMTLDGLVKALKSKAHAVAEEAEARRRLETRKARRPDLERSGDSNESGESHGLGGL